MFSPSEELLPVEIAVQLNPCNILQSFSKCERLTVFLNRIFNTYDIYTLDKDYFFLFLKNMIKLKRIGRYELSFFKHHKEDKVIKMVHEKFPHLKRIEVMSLISLVKKDEEIYPQFAETVGLEIPKKKKLTKKDKIKIEKNTPATSPAKPPAKPPKKEKTKPVVKVASFDAWKEQFKHKET